MKNCRVYEFGRFCLLIVGGDDEFSSTMPGEGGGREEGRTYS
jgi:hypothetical protein